MSKYRPIYWDMNRWVCATPTSFLSIEAAKNYVDSFSLEKPYLQIIHESWVECLAAWPTPEEQEDARLYSKKAQ